MPSYGPQIEKMLHDYLHSTEIRDKVQEGANASDAAVKSELSAYTHTGELMRESHASVHEFDAGWGMEVTSLWRSFFVANKRGLRLKRTGFRRGKGMRRKDFKGNGAMKVAKPSVFGEAVEVLNNLWLGE